MSSKQTHLLLLGLLVALLVAIVGGAYGINKLLESQSSSLVAQKAKVAALDQQQTNLIQAKKDIATYAELYRITKAVVPENKDQAETVRQIVKIATANAISLASISFPASTLGGTGAGAAAGSGVAPKPAPVAATGKINLSQLLKVPSIQGVYVLEINVVGNTAKPVSYPQLISFLNGLEKNRLTAEVTSITITPSQDSFSKFSFNLNLNSYIKP